jgi:hypothetical protein
MRKNAEKTRGKPFELGNAGRPKGTRNKTTLALEALLDGEAEALTRKAVEMALAGDGAAMRLVMDRILPPRKERPVMFAMPKLENVGDAVKATAALAEAVANGDITPGRPANCRSSWTGSPRRWSCTRSSSVSTSWKQHRGQNEQNNDEAPRAAGRLACSGAWAYARHLCPG